MTIEIIKFQPIQKGFLISQVDIKLKKWGNFIIRKVKIFEKDDKRWLSFPSEEYEKEGKKQYYFLCCFEDKGMTDAFHKLFFESYDKYVSELPVST